MIAPGNSRKHRYDNGPAGFKDSMRSRNSMDGQDGYGDDGDMPDDGGDGHDGSSAPSMATVPLDCLQEDGSNPQVGDTVSFSCEGVVQSADGTNAKIKLKTVNGESCDYDSDNDRGNDGSQDDNDGGDGSESTSAMGARLRAKAGSIA